MDRLLRTVVHHKMILTAVISRNKTRTLMMVLTRVLIIQMMATKMSIISHVINGRINHSHMVVEVHLIEVLVHPHRIEIQVRKMILGIKDNPKHNAVLVTILEIKTVLVLLVNSPVLVVDPGPADSLVV